MSHHPLMTADILTIIAKYTNNSDNVQCLRVCKAFYAVFIGKVWESVNTTRLHRFLADDATKAFEVHSDLVQILSVHPVDPIGDILHGVSTLPRLLQVISTLPRLHTLHVTGVIWPDEELRRLLDKLQQLRVFKANHAGYTRKLGPRALLALISYRWPGSTASSHLYTASTSSRRLCDTLEWLELGSNSAVDGWFSMIMTHCVRLKKFKTGMVPVKEVLERKGWICLGLEMLRLEILFDDDDQVGGGESEWTAVAKKLAQVQQLKRLEIMQGLSETAVKPKFLCPEDLAPLKTLIHMEQFVLHLRHRGARKVCGQFAEHIKSWPKLTYLHLGACDRKSSSSYKTIKIWDQETRDLIDARRMNWKTCSAYSIDFEIPT